MATPQIHVRSISLPTRLNPTNFDIELQKLKSFPISSEAIQSGLLGLAELYNSVDELMESSSHRQDSKSMEDSLEGSIEMLDSCSSIRELFQMIKENVQTLQSALRRKGSIQSDVATYACLRKKMNKCIAKTLKTLKKLDHKNNGSNADSNLVCLFREVRGVTITILKSILMFLSCPMAKTGGWSFVSKMMITKSFVANEVACVDFALSSKALDVQMVQKLLQNLDDCVEGIEIGLERLFRQLVRCRVTLLNILTDF